ncbi:hypothetical protein Pcinc_017172 [Petrolisthes cinctipes]|uniref:Homeobox domain-containing protein n=1 Tax=Petrolisthes cinctipes TaxID=88211 RepID=A0AAE1FR90_PETCI|nr:hypothetical protein Pcinc_017172 [Petrolisthes cinctipes]
MVTQVEEVVGSAVDQDGGSSASPLDHLPQYSLVKDDLDYFESSLGETEGGYYEATTTISTTTTSTTTTTHGYSNDKFTSDMVSYYDNKEQLKSYLKFESCDDDLRLEDDLTSYDDLPSSFYDSSLATSDPQPEDFGLGSFYDGLESDHHHSLQTDTHTGWTQGVGIGSGKGKIGPLQRRALDSIFTITEKPSRGMALHIASELGLHYLTVKNFFSNGRRRLRRAAAKLSDPERSKRENERRKEKRRLTALASAAIANGDGRTGSINGGTGPKTIATNVPATDSPSNSQTQHVSPERKALMEKLADKVQRRSGAVQRSLATDFEMAPQHPTHTHTLDLLATPHIDTHTRLEELQSHIDTSHIDLHTPQTHTSTLDIQTLQADLYTQHADMQTPHTDIYTQHIDTTTPQTEIYTTKNVIHTPNGDTPTPQDFLTTNSHDLHHTDTWSLF